LPSTNPLVLGLLVLLGSLLPALSQAAAFGTVSGVVRNPSGRPVPEARVELLSPVTHQVRHQLTDARGRFDFPAVPIGKYLLEVRRRGFLGSSQRVTVESGYFPFAHLVLTRQQPGTLARVTVSAPAELPVVASVTPITLVSEEDIVRTPGAINVNSLAMITDYVPGAYETHDMLHMRGGHQTSWLIDGVEIPNTNIASNLGPAIDPQDIQTLGVERGSYQADEGDRTYGIFNVIPKNGFGSRNQGLLDVTAGKFGQTNDYLSVASHTNDFAYYTSLEGNRSNLGLQTPVSQVIHDQSLGYGAFTNLIYEPSAVNEVRFVGQLRQDDYQIPNCPPYDIQNPNCTLPADDVQREADNFALLSWMHTFTHQAVFTSSILYHYNRANYDGGAIDPLTTTNHHSSQYEGAQEDLQLSLHRNHFDIGALGFAQQDQSTFSLMYHDGSGTPTLSEAMSPSGAFIAAWLQDTFQATHWLNLSAGVRQSHFQGAHISENATDPRLGMTVMLPRLNWALSAFWGKYYQAPPLETISGPLLAYATANDTGFLPLHGERDTERQFGLAIPLKGWTINADYFVNEARNFFDHNPIGNSDIFLPLTDQGALIKGYELTVRSPPFWRYGRVRLAYSNQTADAFGAITGGLISLPNVTGGYYALDHDQRNTLNLGYEVNLPLRFFLSANLSVNSGLSNGDAPPSHLPSYAALDLSAGRNVSRYLSISVTALNLTNRHLLTDNSLTFGGIHWNDPFQIYAELRYKFHY
jgi:hypothetical protein